MTGRHDPKHALRRSGRRRDHADPPAHPPACQAGAASRLGPDRPHRAATAADVVAGPRRASALLHDRAADARVRRGPDRADAAWQMGVRHPSGAHCLPGRRRSPTLPAASAPVHREDPMAQAVRARPHVRRSDRQAGRAGFRRRAHRPWPAGRAAMGGERPGRHSIRPARPAICAEKHTCSGAYDHRTRQGGAGRGRGARRGARLAGALPWHAIERAGLRSSATAADGGAAAGHYGRYGHRSSDARLSSTGTQPSSRPRLSYPTAFFVPSHFTPVHGRGCRFA